MCTFAKIKAFPHIAKHIDQNREKDNGGSRWDLQLIGQYQTSQTSDVTDTDGQPDDFFETVCE